VYFKEFQSFVNRVSCVRSLMISIILAHELQHTEMLMGSLTFFYSGWLLHKCKRLIGLML